MTDGAAHASRQDASGETLEGRGRDLASEECITCYRPFHHSHHKPQALLQNEHFVWFIAYFLLVPSFPTESLTLHSGYRPRE